MTVIRPNSVSGINSITAQADEIKVFKSNGTQGGLIIGGANLNATTGISTLLALNVTGNVSIAGTLTYQDVTNVDSIGIITARAGVNVSAGQLDVGSNIKLGNAGVITATSFVGSGANLTGLTVPGGGTGLDLNDGVKLRLGTGNDIEFYHSSNQNIINYINGNLIIKRGTNSNTNSIQFDGNGHMYVPDDYGIYFGGSSDLHLSHRSSDESAVIKNFNDTGFLRLLSGDSNSSGILLKNRDDDVTYLRAKNEQGVELYYANSVKFETVTGGVQVTGAYELEAASGQPNPTIDNADGGQKRSLYFKTGATARLIIQDDGHTRPASNNTYDLGTTGDRWRNIYTNDLNLSNEGSPNSVDNTWGNYTIQEGESDLFLINNRNGKKYKFNLTEVS